MERISKNRIPISPFLDTLKKNRFSGSGPDLAKKRLFYISTLSVAVALVISAVAKVLVSLINLVTNISFFGTMDLAFRSPSENQLGLWVIFVPVLGGILVGLMALYGSKAIRGHGIPEAMEQVLTNQSRIKPAIAILKPVSSAIAIGTGGPFGAATAGMSAIFGTPIAAIFLAIELLLFEFSPKAIIPVALACITGAAGHHLLFESGPVFPMPELSAPSNQALGIYSLVGICIGLLAVGLTKVVYLIEDTFEKLPIHWMWWPALGGVAVGLIGFISPHTLGVGYDNIINLLSGKLSLAVMISLCIFKFLSWAIALGSGTSGGTLAPLMTIGGATGAIIGYLILSFFPGAGISVPMTALVGMSAMFAGASRAYLTSIVFSLEATHQINGLLPLLGACTGAYLVSFFLMQNTIMTEKIARRGVLTPDAYGPDPLASLTVRDVLKKQSLLISLEDTLGAVRSKIQSLAGHELSYAVTDDGKFKGTLITADIFRSGLDTQTSVSSLVDNNTTSLRLNDSLQKAIRLITTSGQDGVPVYDQNDNDRFFGLLSSRDILSSYHNLRHSNETRGRNLSYSMQRKKALSKGRKLLNRKTKY
ncbi:MAG: chloride channel protein [Pedobacter sp.]|nr:MAG: chloride channel protein [Pedobacter sp.]